ncbi:MAG TPA: sulfotransferase domain-containing protein, partial [Terriglobales bacterium]|nr:sulfotransferase domain-containing protein [Terriglobales bacterium]
LYGIKYVLKYALGKDIAGRNLAVYPDDTFIVSYPRSGNTWTRFLIANLLYPEQAATFTNIERLVPDAEAQSNRMLKTIPRPRCIKSHEYFDHRYRQVIYIVRDPRDVALSYYNFVRKYRHIEDGYPLDRYVDDFVSGRLSSADWGTWGENVGTWITARAKDPKFLLLRYEDMLENPARDLARIAEFFSIEADAARLANVIERSSAQRMRELEQKQGDQWVSTKNRRKDIPFVGTASWGGWRTKMSTTSVARIESEWGALMQFLNYELVTEEGQQRNRDRGSWPASKPEAAADASALSSSGQ